MSGKKVIVSFVLLLFIVAGIVVTNFHVKFYRHNIPAENQRAEALMVSPTLLKVISGEFKGLWADP